MKLPLKISITFLTLFLSFFPFLSQSSFAQAEAPNPSVLGESTESLSDNQKMLLSAKPAIVQVVDIVTGQIVLQAALANELNAPALVGRSYKFEIGGSGSGFFVTPQGHLITNGHVAKPDIETIAYYAIYQQTETIYKDALKIVVEANYNYTPTDAELDAVFQQQIAGTYGGSYENLVEEFVTGYKSGEMDIDNVKISNYIQTGVALGSSKLVRDQGKAANLIDSLYEGDYSSKDLALLKIEGSNFPTLDLGSFEKVNIGTEIYAIGYPGIVEKLMGELTDTESELEPSITKGIISAKKKLVDGTETFQTDAAITHGNSGGAAIGTDGKVIGVTTWGFGDLAGGESFNFLISVEKVKELLAKNNVTPAESATNVAWEKGLELYSSSHHSAAIKEFETAKRLYPDNLDVDKYISLAQTAVSQGKDIPLLFGIRQSYVIIGGAVIAFTLLIIVAIVLLLVLKRKKKPIITAATTPAAPAETPKTTVTTQEASKGKK